MSHAKLSHTRNSHPPHDATILGDSVPHGRVVGINGLATGLLFSSDSSVMTKPPSRWLLQACESSEQSNGMQWRLPRIGNYMRFGATSLTLHGAHGPNGYAFVSMQGLATTGWWWCMVYYDGKASRYTQRGLGPRSLMWISEELLPINHHAEGLTFKARRVAITQSCQHHGVMWG